jgi:hypothetical protein
MNFRNDISTTIKLYWPFASRALSSANINTHFDIYSRGFIDGHTLAENKYKKEISDRELRIAGLLSTIEELKGHK